MRLQLDTSISTRHQKTAFARYSLNQKTTLIHARISQ